MFLFEFLTKLEVPRLVLVYAMKLTGIMKIGMQVYLTVKVSERRKENPSEILGRTSACG